MIPGNFLQDNCWMGSDCPYHSNIQQLKSQLRTLAQAVLYSHNSYSRDVPPVQSLECDCETCTVARACTIAREVLK